MFKRRTFTVVRAKKQEEKSILFLVCSACRGHYHPLRLECKFCGTSRGELVGLAPVHTNGDKRLSENVASVGSYSKRVSKSVVPEGFSVEQLCAAPKPKHHINSIGQVWKA